MQLEREWRSGLAFLKVDIEKAFDNVSRSALAEYLERRLGKSYELRVWQSLMTNSSAELGLLGAAGSKKGFAKEPSSLRSSFLVSLSCPWRTRPWSMGGLERMQASRAFT